MPLFRADEEQAVRELFARLERDVELVLVHGPEETPLPARATSTSAPRRRPCSKRSPAWASA